MKLKIFLLLLCAAGAGVLAAAQLRSDYDPKLPRKVNVGQKSVMVLDKNTHIVLPPKSKPTAKFAAEELAKFLGKCFNSKIQIVPAPMKNGVAIVVGENSYAKTLGIDTGKFDRDGFAIKSGKNMIVIAGRDSASGDPARKNDNYFEHATLFGAYDFLERFAGSPFLFSRRVRCCRAAEKSDSSGQY